MAKEDSLCRGVVAHTTLLPQVDGATTLHWDASSGICRDLRSPLCSAPGQRPAFQAKGAPAIAHRARPYWTTREISFVPMVSPQTIQWEQEAALVTFDLDRVLLADTAHTVSSGATGELVWVHCLEETASSLPTVHPALLIHATYESFQADRVTIAPGFQAHDPLLRHIALVLQAAVEGEDMTGHLYAESLTNALVIHFLRRYAASRPSPQEVTGRLSPYKLHRAITYIQAHLAQELSLPTLAAVVQTSPAHFARVFKHATGLAPHQYVTRCRLAHAKQLLTGTDLPLSEIGLQVGCADQSHFTALFRTHVSLTPKAYRDHTRRA